jgi:hypothetical protein
MTKPGGESLAIDPPVYWMDVWSGAVWWEKRFHRGRVVLGKLHAPGVEIRLYRAQDDPGTGAAVLGAPNWIRTVRPS